LDLYAPRRPHPPQREPRPPLSGLKNVVLSRNSLSPSTIGRGGLSRRREREHREGISAVRVDEHRRSQIVGADEGGEAREHGDEHTGKAPERIDLPLEPLCFLPERRRRPGTERIAIETERQVVSAKPGRPQAHGQAFARQCGQLVEDPYSPPAEGRGEVGSEVERGYRDLREGRPLASGRDDRDGSWPGRSRHPPRRA